MEIVLTTDLSAALPATIDFNHEALKTELSGKLNHYNSLIVTEDAIKEAKTDRSTLNKLRTAVEDKRKEVKKACLTPYEDFECKVKEIVSMIDQPMKSIDDQIKAFSDKKRDEKYASILRFYQNNIKELIILVPIDKVLNPKWANTTMDSMTVTREMMQSITQIRNDLGIIRAMKSAYEQQTIDTYLQTLNMSAALTEKKRLEDQAEKLEEMKSAAQHQTKKTAVDVQFTDVSEPTPASEMSPMPAFNVSVYTPDPQAGNIKTIKVVFYNTTEGFRSEMKSLTDKYSIKYGGISDGSNKQSNQATA